MQCRSCHALVLDGREVCEECGTSVLDQNNPVRPDYKRTDATRLLCAACYLDPLFRTHVYTTYVEDRYRAIAPNFGVDLPTVVRHCLDARHRALLRNIAVTGVMALTVLLVLGGSFVLAPAVFVIGLFAVNFAYEWQIFNLVRTRLAKRQFEPDALGKPLEPDFDYLADNAASNVVVYGGFDPFVGSGVQLNAWNFSLDLRKSKDFGTHRAEPLPFSLGEVYEAVNKAVDALGLHNVSREDLLFVSGRDVRDDSRFMNGALSRPHGTVEPRVITDSIEHPSMRLRHYRCIRVVDWNGELVLSLFFRFAMSGHHLFTEVNTRLLVPVEDAKRTVDAIHPEATILQVFYRVRNAALLAVINTIWSPMNVLYRLVMPLVRPIHHWYEDWRLSENPSFDYGATNSLRAEACGANYYYRRYGLKLDGEMSQKVLEQTMLDSLVRFLDEHGIDTTELKDRESTILNYGVMMSGGTISGSVAAGPGARSFLKRIGGKRRKAKGAAAGAAA